VLLGSVVLFILILSVCVCVDVLVCVIITNYFHCLKKVLRWYLQLLNLF